MTTKVLGRTDITVSEIGLGCWAIGGPDWNLNLPMGWAGTDDHDALQGLHHAVDLGVNHLDTADVYGHGHSERLIGQLLKSVRRERLVISTKVGYFRGCAPHGYHPAHLRHQLEMSLSNLGTDYIDIYYLHHLDFGQNGEYLDDAVEAMRRFKSEGKIRAIGQRGPHRFAPERHAGGTTSADKYERFLHVAASVEPEVIQTRYNMLSPTLDEPATDLFAWAKAHGAGVVINKPLAQGLLLDKYDPDTPPQFPNGDHRARKRWFEPAALRVLHDRLEHLKQRFGNTTPALVRVALQYCLARDHHAAVVAGFKNCAQVEMNLGASGHPLTTDDIRFIRSVMQGINEALGGFHQ